MISNKFKVVFCLFLVGCETQHIQERNNNQIRDSYLYAFKINYFKKSLIEGFNNSEEIIAVMARDKSGYGEPILSNEDERMIDSFVKIDNRVMIQDSLNRVGKVSEGAQGKHTITYALSRFQSKWLDSLAKERYKVFSPM